MKNIICLVALVLFVSTTFAARFDHNQPCPSSSLLNLKKVTLTAGTLVILETNESIFSGSVTPGKMVQMKVRTNVMAEGKVAIRTGAQAVGRVKSVNAGTYNDPASITIELYSVQAVDGQQVALNGNEQTITAPMPNQGATADPNTLITSSVMNDIEIKA